jgi:uncharacterized protein
MSEGCCWSAGTDGVLLRVKARTGAGRDTVGAVKAGELLVEVRAAPEKGKANAAIIKVVAGALGIHRDEVSLRRGAASHHKVLTVPLASMPALQALCVPQKET